jgi:hypothetical protein
MTIHVHRRHGRRKGEQEMRSIKKLGSVGTAVLALTAALAASASGANWDPQGVVLHGHGTGLTLTTNTGASVVCTITVNVKATGDLAQTTDGAGNLAGPTFSGCTNSLGITPTTVTSNMTWNITATSTTVADVSTGNAVISIGGGICTITASNVSVPGNTWSNTTAALTANSASNFAISESGLCDGGTTGHMSGSVTVPGASIT